MPCDFGLQIPMCIAARTGSGREPGSPLRDLPASASAGAMRPDQASVWYRRMSMVYALGAWSVLGSLFLSIRKQKESGDEVEQKDDSANETASTSEMIEPIEGFYVETVVTYKEGGPVIQNILDYLKSWTGGPGPEA